MGTESFKLGRRGYSTSWNNSASGMSLTASQTSVSEHVIKEACLKNPDTLTKPPEILTQSCGEGPGVFMFNSHSMGFWCCRF